MLVSISILMLGIFWIFAFTNYGNKLLDKFGIKSEYTIKTILAENESGSVKFLGDYIIIDNYNECYKFYNFDGKHVLQDYCVMYDYSDEDYYFFKNINTNKIGVMDSSFNIIIDAIYDQIYSDKNSSTFIANYNGKIGVIDIQNNIVIPFEYEEYYDDLGNQINLLSEDGYRYCIENFNLGFLTLDGKKINASYGKLKQISYIDEYTEVKFNTVEFNDDYIKVLGDKLYFLKQQNEKVALVSENDTIIFPYTNGKYITQLNNNLIAEYNSNKTTIYDLNANILLTLDYELYGEGEFKDNNNGLYLGNDYSYFNYKLDDKVYLMLLDNNGKVIIKDNIYSATDETYILEKNNKYYLYNYNNEQLIDESYTHMTYIQHIIVQDNKLITDTIGVYACKNIQKDNDGNFSASNCLIYDEKGKKIISEHEKLSTEIVRKNICYNSINLYRIEEDNELKYVDKNENVIVGPINIENYKNSEIDIYPVESNFENSKHFIIDINTDSSYNKGLIDNKGNVIIKPKYEYLNYINDDFILAYNENTYYTNQLTIFNINGEKIRYTILDNKNIENNITRWIQKDDKYYLVGNGCPITEDCNLNIYVVEKR